MLLLTTRKNQYRLFITGSSFIHLVSTPDVVHGTMYTVHGTRYSAKNYFFDGKFLKFILTFKILNTDFNIKLFIYS